MSPLRRSKSSEKPAPGITAPAKKKAKPPVAQTNMSRGRRMRVRLDAFTDALSPAAVRRRGEELKRKTGVTVYGLIALVGFVLVWSLARFVAGTAMYLFAYGLLLLFGTCFFLAPRNLKLAGDRAGLFPRAQEGDRLEVEVSLEAKRRVSTFLLEERVPERLGQPVRVPITRLGSGEKLTHRYSVRCTRRGVYEVGPLVAIAGDPLGLTQRETLIAEPFELLVHPRIELVSDRPLTRQFEDPPIRPPVSKPWPSGLEFYGMREYQPGDDLRRIVWRASARTGKIMVREAEQGITDKITVILDTDRGAHSRDGEGVSESFEAGVRAAASLAVRHLREGYEVKVETNGGPLTRALRGQDKQLILLDAFSKVEMGREPLGALIRRLLGNAQRDAHNVLVTPKLGQGEAAQLKLLLNKGVSILVVALLWDEENADTAGMAAALGCQVASLRPGGDLASALFHNIGAGNRI
ncbi:MAG TPA: DUF58 domain-containing protein [Acidimicrobiales bacterium]|nr:DUF58 domain-containing protein [Acidimicrobiales bacterium]